MIRANFAPWQAILLAVCPILLFWMVITFSVLFFNLLGNPTIGLSLNALILFAGMLFVFEDFPALCSPMVFATLSRLVPVSYTHLDVYKRQVKLGAEDRGVSLVPGLHDFQ